MSIGTYIQARRNLTTACTRPATRRLSSSLNLVGGRVMPGVMSPLHVEPKKIPAAPQLNAIEVAWIMREAG